MIVAAPASSLRAFHRLLPPYLERIRAAAADVGVLRIEELRAEVSFVYDVLVTEFLPRALASEEVLYPMVARLTGTPIVTAAIQKDHAEMLRFAGELSAIRRKLAAPELPAQTATDARRVLYGLYQLGRSYFAKEEEIYLPLLEARLTSAEVKALAEDLDQAAARITAEA